MKNFSPIRITASFMVLSRGRDMKSVWPPPPYSPPCEQWMWLLIMSTADCPAAGLPGRASKISNSPQPDVQQEQGPLLIPYCAVRGILEFKSQMAGVSKPPFALESPLSRGILNSKAKTRMSPSKPSVHILVIDPMTP